jgi:hypothetical protein
MVDPFEFRSSHDSAVAAGCCYSYRLRCSKNQSRAALLAVAGAEVTVVEHQRPEPTGGERLGEAVEVHLLDRGEAVGHDDGGNWTCGSVGQVQPAPQRYALGVELDVLSHRQPLPSASRLGV